jgi:pyruvate,water dikinase
MAVTEPVFDAPGPGCWDLDRSHYTGGATRIVQWLLRESTDAAFRKLFVEFGVPAETLAMRFVHGFVYARLRPLVAPDKPPRRSPPPWVLRIVARAHPEFRRRTAAAARTLEERPWRAEVQRWRDEIRPRLEAANLRFQAVDLPSCSDTELAEHLTSLLGYLRSTYEEHFRLHGFDLGPIGMLILAGRSWDLSASDIVPALVGASPSTSAPAVALAHLRRGVADLGLRPSSLEEVRAASPDLAADLDRYLHYRGATLYSGYDLDTPTLGESPDVVLRTILAGRDTSSDTGAAASVAEALRARVPDAERDRFDDLLADARAAMDMRDDNGPITVQWPTGLLRLAMLEAGGRLAAGDRVAQPHHVFELAHTELPELVATGAGPDRDELAARAEERGAQKALHPPATLGTPEPQPDLSALPGPLRTMIETVESVLSELGMVEAEGGRVADAGTLHGTGIGTAPFVGVARTAESAEEAITRLAPGEVLVTRTTSPAYNLVLTLVGGLVTSEGGPMCHAAVLSRELDIPAVIGAKDALSVVADGDTVEIDPAAGTVTVLHRADPSRATSSAGREPGSRSTPLHPTRAATGTTEPR